MSKPDGGPAFPVTAEQYYSTYGPMGGMTLRDYFAGKALQGFWATPPEELPVGKTQEQYLAGMCEYFYKWADAMIEERIK